MDERDGMYRSVGDCVVQEKYGVVPLVCGSSGEGSVLWDDMFERRAAVNSAFERAVGRARIGEWPPIMFLEILGVLRGRSSIRTMLRVPVSW